MEDNPFLPFQDFINDVISNEMKQIVQNALNSDTVLDPVEKYLNVNHTNTLELCRHSANLVKDFYDESVKYILHLLTFVAEIKKDGLKHCQNCLQYFYDRLYKEMGESLDKLLNEEVTEDTIKEKNLDNYEEDQLREIIRYPKYCLAYGRLVRLLRRVDGHEKCFLTIDHIYLVPELDNFVVHVTMNPTHDEYDEPFTAPEIVRAILSNIETQVILESYNRFIKYQRFNTIKYQNYNISPEQVHALSSMK